MRLSSLSKLTVAAALAATAVPAAAFAAPDPKPAPPHPVLGGSTPAAARALAAVDAAFGRGAAQDVAPRPAGNRGEELTLALLQLRLAYPDLAPQDQARARSYLARPTDGKEFYGANYAKDARPTNDCKQAPTAGSKVCIFWARETVDAPSLKDGDGDGLPNQVEKTRDTMNQVWGRVIDAGGYDQPLPDEKGPNDKLDVYLVDIGGDGLYGYCGSENVGQKRAAAAYCVLDDDYAEKQFPAHTPLQNMQVTAAHEFFHAVQFAYDVREDAWFMESTATWIEDEIYDDVNDNRFYLPQSALRTPEVPLDSLKGLTLYGNWIWWRYLTERFPQENGTGLPTLVRDVWELADNSSYAGTYSMQALEGAIFDRNRDLAQVFAEFGAANRLPLDPDSGIYEEGGAYKKAPLHAAYDLTEKKQSIAEKTVTLAHMTNSTVKFVPSDYYGDPSWNLKVDVDLPSSVHEPYAQLAVFGVDGSVTREFVGLAGDGVGSLQVPFSSSLVKRVELTLTNGDHSYDCGQETSWSCHGTPDKRRDFSFSASAVQ